VDTVLLGCHDLLDRRGVRPGENSVRLTTGVRSAPPDGGELVGADESHVGSCAESLQPHVRVVGDRGTEPEGLSQRSARSPEGVHRVRASAPRVDALESVADRDYLSGLVLEDGRDDWISILAVVSHDAITDIGL